MWNEGKTRRLAREQHGLLSRADLVDLRATRHDLRGHINRGRLEVIHPGVYYLDSVAATWKTMVLAAVLAAGPDALASHRTAARLWDFDAVYGRMIEVTVPYLESPEPQDVIVHRTRRENLGTSVEAIPLTSPERTLFDLAPILPHRVLLKAGRSAVHQGHTNLDDLDRAVGKYGGRGVSGTRRMRWLVRELAEDQSGSVSEIDLKYIILESPLPKPVQQLRIQRPNGENAYPDFAWPDFMKIVEADGFDAHGTPAQLQNDLARQNDLMDLGWEIRRFTATEIRLEPMRVRDDIIRFVDQTVL